MAIHHFLRVGGYTSGSAPERGIASNRMFPARGTVLAELGWLCARRTANLQLLAEVRRMVVENSISFFRKWGSRARAWRHRWEKPDCWPATVPRQQRASLHHLVSLVLTLDLPTMSR
jgi:hypothetical protein